MQSKVFLTRMVSLLLIACFLNLEIQPVMALPISGAAPMTDVRSSFPKDIQSIQVPPELGKLDDLFQGKDGRVVILIQDAHSVTAAQKSIQKIISYFQHKHGLFTVASEGASGKMDTRIFRSFPDQKQLRSVFKKYLEKGELTGATAAAVFNDEARGYSGVEDWEIYEEGLLAFLYAQKNKAALHERLEVLQREMAELKKKNYSAKLLEADRLLSGFLENRVDFMTALQGLSKIKSPPADSALELVLREAGNTEKNTATRDLELHRVVEQFKKKIDGLALDGRRRAIVQSFHQKYQAYSISQLDGASFALFLKETAAKLNWDLKLSAGLTASAGQKMRLEQMEGTKFFRDFKAYAGGLKTSLLETAVQKELDRKTEELDLVLRLTDMKLDQADWESIQAGGIQINLKDGRDLLVPALAFYLNAKKRDRALSSKLLERMKEDGQSAGLLVAGGFHTEGVTRILREKGISYLVLMPAIGDLSGNENYLDQMQGKVSWQKYLKAGKQGIDLFSAFVRGTRDRLLQESGSSASGGRAGEPAGGESQETGDPQWLKNWRDQILRDLAAEGRLADAKKYTCFIDEAVQRKDPETDDLKTTWLQNARKLFSGFEALQQKNQLTQPGILQLLQAAGMAPSAPAGATARNFLSGNQFRLTEANILEASSQPNQLFAEARLLITAAGRPEISSAARSEVRHDDIEAVRNFLGEINSYFSLGESAAARAKWDTLMQLWQQSIESALTRLAADPLNTEKNLGLNLGVFYDIAPSMGESGKNIQRLLADLRNHEPRVSEIRLKAEDRPRDSEAVLQGSRDAPFEQWAGQPLAPWDQDFLRQELQTVPNSLKAYQFQSEPLQHSDLETVLTNRGYQKFRQEAAQNLLDRMQFFHFFNNTPTLPYTFLGLSPASVYYSESVDQSGKKITHVVFLNQVPHTTKIDMTELFLVDGVYYGYGNAFISLEQPNEMKLLFHIFEGQRGKIPGLSKRIYQMRMESFSGFLNPQTGNFVIVPDQFEHSAAALPFYRDQGFKPENAAAQARWTAYFNDLNAHRSAGEAGFEKNKKDYPEIFTSRLILKAARSEARSSEGRLSLDFLPQVKINPAGFWQRLLLWFFNWLDRSKADSRYPSLFVMKGGLAFSPDAVKPDIFIAPERIQLLRENGLEWITGDLLKSKKFVNELMEMLTSPERTPDQIKEFLKERLLYPILIPPETGMKSAEGAELEKKSWQVTDSLLRDAPKPVKTLFARLVFDALRKLTDFQAEDMATSHNLASIFSNQGIPFYLKLALFSEWNRTMNDVEKSFPDTEKFKIAVQPLTDLSLDFIASRFVTASLHGLEQVLAYWQGLRQQGLVQDEYETAVFFDLTLSAMMLDLPTQFRAGDADQGTRSAFDAMNRNMKNMLSWVEPLMAALRQGNDLFPTAEAPHSIAKDMTEGRNRFKFQMQNLIQTTRPALLPQLLAIMNTKDTNFLSGVAANQTADPNLRMLALGRALALGQDIQVLEQDENTLALVANFIHQQNQPVNQLVEGSGIPDSVWIQILATPVVFYLKQHFGLISNEAAQKIFQVIDNQSGVRKDNNASSNFTLGRNYFEKSLQEILLTLAHETGHKILHFDYAVPTDSMGFGYYHSAPHAYHEFIADLVAYALADDLKMPWSVFAARDPASFEQTGRREDPLEGHTLSRTVLKSFRENEASGVRNWQGFILDLLSKRNAFLLNPDLQDASAGSAEEVLAEKRRNALKTQLDEALKNQRSARSEVRAGVEESFEALKRYLETPVKYDSAQAEARKNELLGLWAALKSVMQHSESRLSDRQLFAVFDLAYSNKQFAVISEEVKKGLAQQRTSREMAELLSRWSRQKLDTAAAGGAVRIALQSSSPDDFKHAHPGLAGFLFDKARSKALYEVLSTFRRLLEWRTYEVNPDRGKIERITRNNQPIQIADHVYVRVDTGSFRRHVLYETDAVGAIADAVEIKMPGELSGKTMIDPEDFTVTQELRKNPELRSRTRRALFVLEHPEEADFQIYGRPVSFGAFRVIVFGYDMAGHETRGRLEDYLGLTADGRLDPALKSLKIENRIPDDKIGSVAAQVVLILQSIFASGFLGYSDLVHLQNIGVEEKPDGSFFVTLPNDFGDYTPFNPSDPSPQEQNAMRSSAINISKRLKEGLPGHEVQIDQAFSVLLSPVNASVGRSEVRKQKEAGPVRITAPEQILSPKEVADVALSFLPRQFRILLPGGPVNSSEEARSLLRAFQNEGLKNLENQVFEFIQRTLDPQVTETIAAQQTEALLKSLTAISKDQSLFVGVVLPQRTADVHSEFFGAFMETLKARAGSLGGVPIMGKGDSVKRLAGLLRAAGINPQPTAPGRASFTGSAQAHIPLVAGADTAVIQTVLASLNKAFYPVTADTNKLEDPFVKNYVEVLKVVTAFHTADLLAGDDELLTHPEMLKQKLFARMLLVENQLSTAMLQINGKGIGINSTLARVYLAWKASEAAAQAA